MRRALTRAVALQAAVERVLRHLAKGSSGLSREEVLAAALVRVEAQTEAIQERYLTGARQTEA